MIYPSQPLLNRTPLWLWHQPSQNNKGMKVIREAPSPSYRSGLSDSTIGNGDSSHSNIGRRKSPSKQEANSKRVPHLFSLSLIFRRLPMNRAELRQEKNPIQICHSLGPSSCLKSVRPSGGERKKNLVIVCERLPPSLSSHLAYPL